MRAIHKLRIVKYVNADFWFTQDTHDGLLGQSQTFIQYAINKLMIDNINYLLLMIIIMC